MNFKDIISNTWSTKEVSLLESNINLTIFEIVALFKKHKFDRSVDSIRKKRSKLVRSNTVKPEYSTAPTSLLIPDAHVTCDQDLTKFNIISDLIATRRPNNIIIGGDLADMLSLSAWEKSNKLSIEGRRYKKEIEAINEALDRLLSFKNSCTNYDPNIIYLMGNHENRVERYIETNPTLDGHMDLIEDLKLKQRNILVVPYKKFYELEGVLFTHAPLNAAGQPVSGKLSVHKAAELTSKSLVFFHTHQCQTYSCLRHGDSDLIQIYTAGCLFDGWAPGGYSDDTTHASMKCISFLSHYKTGRFDIEQISLERLYSGINK